MVGSSVQTKVDCCLTAVQMVGSSVHTKADCLALTTAVQMAGSSAQKKAGTKADCLMLQYRTQDWLPLNQSEVIKS